MHSPVEEIKSRLDIIDVIQGYIRLQKAGINYKALCPFHAEKTPSFFVSPTRQIWHCFGGCGKGGDIFKFIMEIEGLDFPEALRLLAQRAGVVLKREDPLIRSERNRLYDICEAATQVFIQSLERTPAAKKYLLGRGVKDETIQDFRLGFAPQSWDFLLKSLAQKGFRREDVEKAGLAVKSEDGSSWYDRFRSRIMFPIADGNARVVGFSGRIFESGIKNQESGKTEAKYVNTQNTLIYDKSRALYGFDKAKQEIRVKNEVIIVEGQMDCIMSYQAGVKNVVAVSGTAFTPYQLKQLKNLCNTIIATFDKDSAGEMATSRSLTLMASDFFDERYVALIPKGKDVADLVCENPQLWKKAAENKQPFVEFFMDRAFEQFDGTTLEGRKKILDHVLPELRRVTNAVLASHWTKILAQKLGTREEAIWENLKRLSNPDTQAERSDGPRLPINKGRRDLLEERFLALLPFVRDEARARLTKRAALAFSSPLNQQLFGLLTAKGAAEPIGLEPNLQATLEMLRFKGEVLGTITKNLEDEFAICGRELEKECVKEQLFKFGEAIQLKERENDTEGTAQLLKTFQELSAQLKQLS